jgi:hypothetical protein
MKEPKGEREKAEGEDGRNGDHRFGRLSCFFFELV